MAERFFNVSPFYTINEHLWLYYGYKKEKVLYPCEEIGDQQLMIGVISNSKLNSRNFLLVEKDKIPITVYDNTNQSKKVLTYPGKSGFIDFDPNAHTKENAFNVVRYLLGGNPDRRDCHYTATVFDINNAEWHVYWAPLQMTAKLTHVRLIADITIRRNKPPEPSDTNKLAKCFIKVC